MRHLALLLLLAGAAAPAFAQGTLSGRLWQPREDAPGTFIPFGSVFVFANQAGPDAQGISFRTWDTEPAGWWRLSGPAGTYAVLFSRPADFMRPVVLTNILLRDGETVDRNVVPHFDYAVYDDSAWDEKPAAEYWQAFTAQGTSVTAVGFKLVHDGVDGIGPGSQNLVLSIHRKGDGEPDTWERVGPEIPVLNVDCGGPKNYTYSAAWNSGDVPLTPGGTYAVRLRGENPQGTFQTFWHTGDGRTPECRRKGADGKITRPGRSLWMAVATDSDGLVIPYNKRVRKEYVDFAGFAPKWSQTWVARGRGLASVLCHVAVGTAEPPLHRERVRVRIRKGGPDGPVVGAGKTAVGSGIYTGDASWGAYAAVYAPGEVALEPGQTYAAEIEGLETAETLHAFTNIKNVVSSEKPGFNPYRKTPPDDYPPGTAFKNGTDPMDFDLDMQIVEYERAVGGDWAQAVDDANRLKNGSFDEGDLKPDAPEQGAPAAWKKFAIDAGTAVDYAADAANAANRFVRVIGGGGRALPRNDPRAALFARPADGGVVQKVEGLGRVDTYRVSLRVRSSWAVDADHQCWIGVDPTGQDEDPKAESIRWTAFPPVHGVFLPFTGDPVRPKAGAVSVWLRGRTTAKDDFPFKAEFDDVALRKVKTTVP